MVYIIKPQKQNLYYSRLTTRIHDFGTNLLQVIKDSKIYNISRKFQNIIKQHEDHTYLHHFQSYLQR